MTICSRNTRRTMSIGSTSTAKSGRFSTSSLIRASNFIFPTDHSKEMTALTLDSVRQYKELGVFTQSGGIEVARTPERMEELKRRTTSATSWGIETELLTPAEIAALKDAI